MNSQSEEDYLKAIYHLEMDYDSISTNSVADYLNMKPSSVTDMLKKLEITAQQNLELKKYCKEKNIIFLTTPFDDTSLSELDMINLPAYKVASTDITNLLFLKEIKKSQVQVKLFQIRHLH